MWPAVDDDYILLATGNSISTIERGAPMVKTAVLNGIPLIAGAIVAWGFAMVGSDALSRPEFGVAALVFTVFGTGWIR
jgi:hypothetical protein